MPTAKLLYAEEAIRILPDLLVAVRLGKAQVRKLPGCVVCIQGLALGTPGSRPGLQDNSIVGCKPRSSVDEMARLGAPGRHAKVFLRVSQFNASVLPILQDDLFNPSNALVHETLRGMGYETYRDWIRARVQANFPS